MFFQQRQGSTVVVTQKDIMNTGSSGPRPSGSPSATPPANPRRWAALGLAVAMTYPAGWAQVALGDQLPPQQPHSPVLAVELAGAEMLVEAELAPQDETLRTAASQYKAGQYEEAQATLQQVNTDALSESDRKERTDLQGRLERAVAGRKEARANYESGEKALAAGNAGEALNYYKAAAGSRFADEGTRNKSLEQIALAENQVKESRKDARGFYNSAVDQYRKGDWIAARQNFNKAKELGFKAGFLQQSPDSYLAKMDAKERADADRAARESGVAAVSTEAQPADTTKVTAEANRATADAARAETSVTTTPPPTPVPAPAATPTPAVTEAPAAQTPSPTAVAQADSRAADEARAQAEADAQARAAESTAKETTAQRKREAKESYNNARNQYRKGDWIAARQNFMRAQELGYKPGLFEDSPAKYLARMDSKEQADAARAAREAEARATAEAQANAAQPATPATPTAGVTEVTGGQSTTTTETTTTTVTSTPPAPAANVNAQVNVTTPAAPDAQLTDTARTERIRQEANQFRANELVTQARAAQAENRYADALNLYTQASDLDPANQQAAAGRQEMLTLTGQTATPAPLLDRQAQQIQVRRQVVLDQFDTAVNDTTAAVARGDYTGAGQSLDRARVARVSDPTIFNQAELAQMDRRIADLSVQVQRGTTEATIKQREDMQRQANEQELARRQREQEERERTVSQLIRNARELIEEAKYEEALKVIDQVLAVDPTNEYAASVRPLVEDRALLLQQRKFREDYDRQVSRHINRAEEARIPYEDIVRFPANWPDISEIRDAQAADLRGEKAADVQVQAILDRKLPLVRFDNSSFTDVMEFFREATGANIYVNNKALETAGIDRNAPVSARLRDVRFSTALRKVLDDVGGGTVKLDYTVEDGVITISTGEDLSKNVVTRVYDIRDLLADVPDFTQVESIQLQSSQRGTVQGGGGGGGNAGNQGGNIFGQGQQNFNQNEGGRDLTRGGRVDSILALVRDTVAPDSWRDNGGLVGSIRDFQLQQLIVTQTPENHRLVAGLLEKLRETRAIQVSIETRFIRVQRNFLEDIGLDIDATFNQNGAWSNRFSPITVNQSSAAFTAAPNSGVPGNISSQVGTGGSSLALSGQYGTFLDDFSVNFLVRATQASENSSLLTAPRLTLFNGQYAQLFIGQEVAYVGDLQPVVGANAAAFTPLPSTVQTGVQMVVQATVSADRKYVTLTLRPRLVSLQQLVPFQVQSAAVGNVGGGVGGGGGVIVGTPTVTTPSAFLQLPTTNVQSVLTTVSVPDGGTLLLGGQTLSGEIEREAGVPGLSKIPFLKRLFTNRAMSKDEQIILILVKPTIIIQREAEQKQFPLLSSKVAG